MHIGPLLHLRNIVASRDLREGSHQKRAHRWFCASLSSFFGLVSLRGMRCPNGVVDPEEELLKGVDAADDLAGVLLPKPPGALAPMPLPKADDPKPAVEA